MAAGEGGASARFRPALPVPSYCVGERLPARRASLPVRPPNWVTARLPLASPHFRFFSPSASHRNFRSLLRTSDPSRPLCRSGTSGPPYTHPVLPFCSATDRLPVTAPHFRSIPRTSSPRDYGPRYTLPVLPEALGAPGCALPSPPSSSEQNFRCRHCTSGHPLVSRPEQTLSLAATLPVPPPDALPWLSAPQRRFLLLLLSERGASRPPSVFARKRFGRPHGRPSNPPASKSLRGGLPFSPSSLPVLPLYRVTAEFSVALSFSVLPSQCFRRTSGPSVLTSRLS